MSQLCAAPVEMVKQVVARLALEDTSSLARIAPVLLARATEFMGVPGGELLCVNLVAYDLPNVIRDLRQQDVLWSPDADQIACALEALAPNIFPSHLDYSLLMLWVHDTVPDEVQGMTPEARAQLLAFRSDTLAYRVCASGSLEEIPQLGELLLQHRPAVVYQLLTHEIQLPVSAAARLIQGYRQRLASDSESKRSRQEVAKALAALLRQLIRNMVPDQALPAPKRPLAHGARFNAAEIGWLGRVLRDCRASRHEHAYDGCALHIVLWVLLGAHECLVAPAAHHPLFVAAYEWLIARQGSRSASLAGRVFCLLASPHMPLKPAVESAMALSPSELDLMIEHCIGRPELFANPELRARVAASTLPEARAALALSAVTSEELGVHLRWLIANAPDLACSAIEWRIEGAVHVLQRSELKPLLASGSFAVRAAACTLLHNWPTVARQPADGDTSRNAVTGSVRQLQ